MSLLIDARRGVDEGRREVMDLLDSAAVSYRLVLTKIDELNAAELDEIDARARRDEARSHVAAAFPDILATSAATGQGMPELRCEPCTARRRWLLAADRLGYKPRVSPEGSAMALQDEVGTRRSAICA